MNYIKRKHKSINQVRMFTNKTILYDYLLDNQINVLLISEDKLQDDIEHDKIEHMCVLSEKNFVSESNYDETNVIYKFQSAEYIIKELFDLYPEISSKTNKCFSDFKVISVFSIDESFARDNFSFNLANQYATKNKTLLIDLNLLHGRYQLDQLNSKKNLSEFLYFLKSDIPNLLVKMNIQVQKFANFDYLKGVSFGPDLYDITFEDLKLWLRELQSSNYEIVIFNIGCYMEATLELFRQSDDLLLVGRQSPWNSNLYENLIEQLNWTGYEDLVNKIRVIKIQKELVDIVNEYELNDIFSKQWGDLAKNYARDNK